MEQRPRKRFVLPYEPEYTAHRRDDNVRRVTRLHLNLRESPSIVPRAPRSERLRQNKRSAATQSS